MAKKITREDLEAEIHRLVGVLGKTPTLEDLKDEGEYSEGAYRNEFGTWNNAIKETGYEVNKRYNIPDEKLIQEIERVSEIVGHTPTQMDMDEHSKYGFRTFSARFGTWGEALVEAGFEPNIDFSISNEDLIDELNRVSDELGRAPTKAEVNTLGEYPSSTYRSRFGDWTTAIKKAGLEPHFRWEIDENELLSEMERVDAKVDGIPMMEHFDEYTDFHPCTVRRKFGSWPNALAEIGIEYKDAHWAPSGKDHPMWIDGKDRYYGPNWDQQRQACLERDEYSCQSCNSEDDLHVHHITPLRVYEEYEDANKLSNLVTLCSSCHMTYEGSHILDSAEEFKEKI